jgi:hypothetical protein
MPYRRAKELIIPGVPIAARLEVEGVVILQMKRNMAFDIYGTLNCKASNGSGVYTTRKCF